MDGGYIIREERHLTVERYGTINEEQDTTPLVTSEAEGKCGDAFVILLIYTIGIGNIVLGAIYINYCPAQKMLPIGIVAFGGIWVVGRLLNCVYDYRNLFKDSEDTPTWLTVLNVSFTLAGFGMLIASLHTNIVVLKSLRATMDNFNRLKGTVKAAITRLEQFLTDTTDIKTTNVSQLEVKLKKTKDLQNKLKEIREQYFDIQDISAQQVKEIEKDIDSAIERFEQVEYATG